MGGGERFLQKLQTTKLSPFPDPGWGANSFRCAEYTLHSANWELEMCFFPLKVNCSHSEARLPVVVFLFARRKSTFSTCENGYRIFHPIYWAVCYPFLYSRKQHSVSGAKRFGPAQTALGSLCPDVVVALAGCGKDCWNRE